MLGLSTHEPHFSLLREEVRFGKAAKRLICAEKKVIQTLIPEENWSLNMLVFKMTN